MSRWPIRPGFLFCCLCFAGCVSAPPDRANSNAGLWTASSPRGRWTIVSYEMNGRVHTLKNADSQFIITDTTFERHYPTQVHSGPYTVDPTRRPTGIDIEFGDASGDQKGSKIYPGIYRVDGDQLLLCLDMSTTYRLRPRTFSTRGTDRDYVLYVCRRER
jgi:uncharacterized protein (TIGR03067 family)